MEVTQAWKTHNEAIDSKHEQTKQEFARRIAALTPTPAAQESGLQSTEPNASNAGLPLARNEVEAAAGAGDQTAMALLSQLEHRIELETTELRDVTTLSPTEEEMPALVHLWAFISAALLELNSVAAASKALGPVRELGVVVGSGRGYTSR